MRRSPLALLALSVVLTPAVPLLTGGAVAADPPGSTEVGVVVVDGQPGVQLFASPLGPRTAIGTGTIQDGIRVVKGSRDGSRFIGSLPSTGEDLISSDPHPGFRAFDVSGAEVANAFYDGPPDFTDDVALSPDGNVLAFSTASGVAAQTADQRSGGRRAVAGGPGEIVFLTNDLVLVERTGFRPLSLSGRSVPAVSGLSQAAGPVHDLTFDPTGARLAYVRAVGAQTRLEVVTVTLSATSVVFGAPQVLAIGTVASPAFTRDGTRVAFVDGADDDLKSVPVGGGERLAFGLPSPGVKEISLALLSRRSDPPTTAPIVTGPARLDGRFAEIQYSLAAFPTSSLVRVTRTPALSYPVEDRPLSGVFTDTQVGIGQTYSYVFRAVDRSGNVGPASSPLSLVGTSPPAMTAADPTSTTSNRASFPVQVAAARNAPDTRYTIDQRVQGGASWARWLTLDSATSRVFGAVAAPGVAKTISLPGRTYVFRGTATDRFGNTTDDLVTRPPAIPVRVVVPFNQDHARLTGNAVTAARSGAYGGEVAFLRSVGASATIRLTGDREQVVGETCPTCGAFDVLLDGVRVARVDTYAAARTPRRVLYTHANVVGTTQTLTVRAVGTPRRPYVVLDAFSTRAYAGPGLSGIVSGQSLSAITSPSGGYVANLWSNGRLMIYSTKTFTSTPVLGSARGTRLTLGRDGNLVLYTAVGKVAFQTRTASAGPSILVMRNDGNLVLYRARDGKPTWSSRSGIVR